MPELYDNRRTILFADGDGVNLPAWSPDGNRIAYNNDSLGQLIYVANPFDIVGIPLRPLSGRRANAPAWSPDGTKLAYHDSRTNGGLYIIDGDGTNPVRLVATTSTVFNEAPDWFGFNTPTGANVSALLGTTSITFSSVSNPGTTTVVPINPADAGALPGGFSLGAGFPAFEISTTATFTAPITVCLQVPSVTDPAVFSALDLLHKEGAVLVPRTSSRDFATRTICAVTNSLSRADRLYSKRRTSMSTT